MAGRSVLVLGGGVGGVVAANELRRRLDPRDRVMVVEREARHLFQPSLAWLMVGRRRPERISRPLGGLLTSGVELLAAEVRAVDPLRRSVDTNAGALPFDALVVALGAELAPDAFPGFSGAYDIFSVAGATACARALAGFRGGRLVVAITALPYKCPAAPYEAAMLVEAWLRKHGLRASTELDFWAAEPGPMGVAGPAVSAAVRQMVESRGIRYHPEHQVTAVDPAARTLAFANGSTAAYDVLIYVPPHRAPAVVRRSGLAPEGGWVAVDRGTFETGSPGVYAIGDVTTVPLAMGKPLPKAGVFAHGQAEVVAANIAPLWAGSGPRRRFDGHGECFVETGAGRAGFGAGNFYAEPLPQVDLRGPGRAWHWAKVLFEWKWLRGWF